MTVVKKAASTKTITTKPERYLLINGRGPYGKRKSDFACKDLGINPRTAMCWWKRYQETGKITYEKL